MKHKLHLFSWLLLFVALFAPVKTMAQVTIGNFTYTFSGTEATVTKISPLTANIVIPSTVEYGGKTYDVTTLDNFAADDDNTITSVIAPSIKKIIFIQYSYYSRFLSGQNKLSLVSFPALETINGSYVFTSLPKLTTLSLPSLTTIDITDNGYCISNLPLLTSLNLPKLSVIRGSDIIASLPILTSLSLPELTAVNGTAILSGCDSLTSLDVHKLKKIEGSQILERSHLSEVTFADGCELGLGWGFMNDCQA